MRTRGFSVAGSAQFHLALVPMLILATASCGDKGPKYPSCGSDKDCRKGEHCVNRTCRQCASDSHCKEGQSCEAGACRAPPGSCTADGDCDGAQVCVQGRCRSCTEDPQCGPDRKCRSGRCLARGRCGRNEDCADDEDCVRGECKRPGRARPPNVSCQLRSVYFSFDQAGLGREARDLLVQVAECVQSAPGRGVFLNGLTDPRGTEEYNIGLSERRARVVADYLARQGIDPARFRVVPRGETQASGSDESGWARDRRVDIEWQ
jgi:peptidoglycan-associated lipoprotein